MPYFGYELSPAKPPQHLRLVLANVGRLPVFKEEAKSRHFLDQLRHYHTDVLLGTEHGWNVKGVPPGYSWTERTRGELPRQASHFAWNTHDQCNNQASLAGGTFMVALHQAQPRICDRGKDTTGLGRWTWMRVQGRHGHHTRIISAYRPCKNRETLGTTYRQQETYWTNNNEPRCPIKVFDEQLEALLDLWLTPETISFWAWLKMKT